MKILFVGAFDNENKSTNNSQARGFASAGAEVFAYPHRDRCALLGQDKMEEEILQATANISPDLIVFAKWPDNTSEKTFQNLCDNHFTCFWWMDPVSSLREKQHTGMSMCDIVITATPNTVDVIREYNKNTFLVYEGFDHLIDKPHDTNQEFDVCFIGSLHTDRRPFLAQCTHGITHVEGAYAEQHARAVSMSKINLNVCTNGGASDRIFKIMGAGGFLLTDNWIGRESMFQDGKHLVIYDGIDDMNEKIDFYLTNENIRNEIAKSGWEEVQKYNRDNWAAQILEIVQSFSAGESRQ